MTYRRAEHTAWRDLGDETVVVDLTAHQMIGLNPTAGYLWQALDGTVRLERLAAELAADGVRLELADLERFCAELAELGLLEVADPGPREAADLPSLPDAVERQPPTAPAILWREPIRQAAGTCAFMPTMSPLCNQVPFT